MSKLKEQFSELRKNTPKRVQWLLMAAAFVVVLILLTLLLSGDKDNEVAETDTVPIALKIDPDMVNWPDVVVGTQKTQTIRVSANAPAKIVKVERNIEVPGLLVDTNCPGVGPISNTIACKIIIKYAPSTVMKTEQVPVFIHWHGESETDAMLRKDTKIVLTLGAIAPKQDTENKPKAEKKPEPVVTPEPEPVYEPLPEPEPVVIKQEIKREVETIAPAVDFDKPAQTEKKVQVQEKSYEIPDGCSDFAFPGYNSYGTQIGWIKPDGGAYKFYPFSDKECKNATGTYNPDNGIITDNKGKKIGTDADHIGYGVISNGILPDLGNSQSKRVLNQATQLDSSELEDAVGGGAARLSGDDIGFTGIKKKKYEPKTYLGSAEDKERVRSSRPYDRSFILRQYKPIPATIVSEIRADPQALKNNRLPVRATVDRNVYSDNGRNIIIPTGTLLLGYIDGDLPGPYTSIGRMNIKWYQFILPNGIEFNFDTDENSPFSGDAQGRSGVPGYGSTDYMEQFIMPMLTAIVPAAVNLIAPVSDAFVNQIDLDNNTVVQSGTVRSSELAKNEIITAWNQVAQKLMVDMMDNTVPPFSIAAGTRITVYSPADLVASCGEEGEGKKCSLGYADTERRSDWKHSDQFDPNDASWIGQVRSFAVNEYCVDKGDGTKEVAEKCKSNPGSCGGYSYSTLLFYCQSSQYEAINNARQNAVYQNQKQQFANQGYETTNTKGVSGQNNIIGNQAYNEQVLGLKYDEETGAIQNPFNAPKEEVIEETIITCEDGNAPDANGCCAGEIYTDMGDQGFNCCPEAGGDCFPPIL